MAIIILGQGKWGKRLKKEYEEKGKVVKTWSHTQLSFDIDEAESIIIAIPSPYLVDVLQQFKVNPNIPVFSCTKGLDICGRLPSAAIKLFWDSKEIFILGGACISTEPYLQIIIESNLQLEIAGILKNVYAIGFNIVRAEKGDNAAAAWFIDAWEELKSIVGSSYYLSDLVVTCMSERSRNSRAGKMIAQGRNIDFSGEVAEGLYTAKTIKCFNLFKDNKLLWNIIERIGD